MSPFGISNLALNALFRVSPSQKEGECLREKTDKCCFVKLTTTVFEIKIGDANHSVHHKHYPSPAKKKKEKKTNKEFRNICVIVILENQLI